MLKIPNKAATDPSTTNRCNRVLNLGFWSFEFVWDLDIGISDLAHEQISNIFG